MRGIYVYASVKYVYCGIGHVVLRDKISFFMITEWDMSALPTVNQGANVSDTTAYQKQLNPYPDGLPEDIDTKWNNRMADVMRLLRYLSFFIAVVCFYLSPHLASAATVLINGLT